MSISKKLDLQGNYCLLFNYVVFCEAMPRTIVEPSEKDSEGNMVKNKYTTGEALEYKKMDLPNFARHLILQFIQKINNKKSIDIWMQI